MERAPQNRAMQIITRHTIIVVIILGTVAILVFGIRFFFLSRSAIVTPPHQKIHYYENPSLSIEQIRIKAFYVQFPGDTIADNWRAALEASLIRIGRFHQLQFLGKSSIAFDVYPEPILVNASPAGQTTAKNAAPALLEALRKSLEYQIEAAPRGLSQFMAHSPNEYAVTLFLVESPETEIAHNALAFPRYLLTDAGSSIDDSFLYHAFAQTLGIPPSRQDETDAATPEDIMGYGKFRPLELNYLSTETTRKMGLIE